MRTHIEVCPTSNLLTLKLVTLKDHPGLETWLTRYVLITLIEVAKKVTNFCSTIDNVDHHHHHAQLFCVFFGHTTESIHFPSTQMTAGFLKPLCRTSIALLQRRTIFCPKTYSLYVTKLAIAAPLDSTTLWSTFAITFNIDMLLYAP